MTKKKPTNEELLETFEKMAQMFTNIVGTQRETIALISTLGKMVEATNKQVDLLTKLVLEKDKIHLT